MTGVLPETLPVMEADAIEGNGRGVPTAGRVG
jgi:hypothetical protein